MFILLFLHNFPSLSATLAGLFLPLEAGWQMPISFIVCSHPQHSLRPHSETRSWQLLLYETWLRKWTPRILAVKIFMMFIKPFFPPSTFVTIIMGIWIMNSVTTILLSTFGKCLLSQFVPHDFKWLPSPGVLFRFQTTHCKQQLLTLIRLIVTHGGFLSLPGKNAPLRFQYLSP